VTGARLNTANGRLTIEGSADLEQVRAIGRTEGYAIAPEPARRAAGLRGVTVGVAGAGHDAVPPTMTALLARPDAMRAIVAGVALAAGYVVQLLAGGAGAAVGGGAVGGGATAGGAVAMTPATVAWMVLFAIAVVVGGWSNFKRAAFSIPRLDFNMAVLMSVAVIGAVLIRAWDEAAVVAFLYSASDVLTAWSVGRARRSIRDLLDAAPPTVRVVRQAGEVVVGVEDVAIGETMVLKPGEKIALDGEIVEGAAAIDESSITGESVPAERGVGDAVFAGTLDTDGSLRVRVTHLCDDSTLARIIDLVEEAQGSRAPSQAFVDRFAAVYTPAVLALAAGIVLLPPLVTGQPWAPWIYRGLALLVVSCPCALVVSTPVAIVSAIGNAARNGVLVKGGVYLELMGQVKAVAFDKTGTLTRGRPELTDAVVAAGAVGPDGIALTVDELLCLGASLEAGSEHPLARAVLRGAEGRGCGAHAVTSFRALAGLGARGQVDGIDVRIGNLRLFEGTPVAEAAAPLVAPLHADGKTAMLLATETRLLGVIAVADQLRDGASEAVAALRVAGIRHVVMLTGDNRAAAEAIAARTGVDETRAELLPEDKVAAVRELLAEHGAVAMVGDGVNDAPALATATVGIAMGGAGTDAALETADIALMSDDLSKLPFTVRLSRATLSMIRQNIAFSLAVKLIAVALVFPGWLTLWLAILSDMGATLVVTLNAMRLLRVRDVR
jgi:Cd2+/Zn2+-exporting ATPase